MCNAVVFGGVGLALYLIGGLLVDMTPKYDELALRAEPFCCGGTQKPDIELRMDEAETERRASLFGLSLPLAEYQYSCEQFCEAVLRYNAFVLHASAAVLNGNAYLFSAQSGVGKSTHAEKWKRCFGARIVNDDKPLIRCSDGGFNAYGTPWCGSGFERLNEYGRVNTLFFLKRADNNTAYKLDADTSLFLLLDGMYRPNDSERMDMLFATLERFLAQTHIMCLECNTEDEAAYTALAATEDGYEN